MFEDNIVIGMVVVLDLDGDMLGFLVGISFFNGSLIVS